MSENFENKASSQRVVRRDTLLIVEDLAFAVADGCAILLHALLGKAPRIAQGDGVQLSVIRNC